jgi:hypothetical protein
MQNYLGPNRKGKKPFTTLLRRTSLGKCRLTNDCVFSQVESMIALYPKLIRPFSDGWTGKVNGMP